VTQNLFIFGSVIMIVFQLSTAWGASEKKLHLDMSALAQKEKSQAGKVTQKQIDSLQKKFKSAKSLNSQQMDFLSGKHWGCDMYGVRSRNQIKKKVNLYEFTLKAHPQNPGTHIVRNTGAQVIKKYNQTLEGLKGSKGPLKEVVRITPSQHLIAELSIKTPPESSSKETPSVIDQSRSVVAYSICQ